MIKAIIFDLGRVCVHIDWIKINEEMIKKFGISSLIKSSGNQKAIEHYLLANEGKSNLRNVFREMGIKEENLDKVLSFYKEQYKKHKTENKEIIELIAKLRNKFKIFCLTDTNEAHFEVHLKEGVYKNFEKTFASFQLGMIKANKEVFNKVLSEIKFKPEEIIFIDDNNKNIENAKSLGINTILFKDNNQLIKDLEALGVKT